MWCCLRYTYHRSIATICSVQVVTPTSTSRIRTIYIQALFSQFSMAGGKRKTEDSAPTTSTKKAKSVKATVTHIERTPIERKAKPPQQQTWTGLCWNVAGLRTLVKTPEKMAVLQNLVKQEAPDVLCLSEHKLQEKDVEDMRGQLRTAFPEYESHWAVSTGKKGYSGVVALIKGSVPHKEGAKKNSTMAGFMKKRDAKKELPSSTDAWAPVKVTFPTIKGATDEGRLVTVEYGAFHVVCVYVPNSGMALDRLKYRTTTWDEEIRTYLRKLSETKPVIYCGDLNVAHLDCDIWNVDAKHIIKQAGTTKEERESFGKFLSEERLVDTFHRAHPNSEGCFTYWSMRAGNRPFNKGLRLDYFLASESLYDETSPVQVYDAFILPDATNGAGDHCPIGITLAFK